MKVERIYQKIVRILWLNIIENNWSMHLVIDIHYFLIHRLSDVQATIEWPKKKDNPINTFSLWCDR